MNLYKHSLFNLYKNKIIKKRFNKKKKLMELSQKKISNNQIRPKN